MPQREDDVAPRTGAPDRRVLVQGAGFVLAVAATLAVFLTDNPQFLKLAVVAVAWAFVLATFAAASRSTERAAARARENELRRAYQYELDREVAARREYELELETELRREAEESMRAELDALRDDLAGLSHLRDDVARVAELRTDLGALSSLRDEVARLAALRDDVAGLTSLRQEIGQLSELRADMARLRQELTEQLSSEMLIERIVMRTQASRLGSEPLDAPGRTIDARWTDDAPPRELTGGWPAVRLDEPRETRQFEEVRVERAAARPPVPPGPAAVPPPTVSRPVPSPSWRPSWESEPEPARSRDAPPTASWETPSTPSWAAPETLSWESPSTAASGTPTAPPPAFTPPAASGRPAHPPPDDRWSPAPEGRWSAPAPAPDAGDDTPLWSSIAADTGDHLRQGTAEPVPPTAAFPMAPPSGGSRAGAVPPTTANPVVRPLASSDPAPSPLEWLAARALVDAEPHPTRPDVSPRRRRGDEPPVDPAVAPTTQRPAVPANPPIRVDDRGSYRVAVREEPAERSGPEKRLEDILAENGVTPATGGRRRRRYRDEDEPDDVLARVLGTN